MAKKYLISIGNKKLSRETMIFNLCSASECPTRNVCDFGKNGTCYAMKAERIYPQVLPYRTRQKEFWYSTTIDEKIEYFRDFLSHHKNIKYLRINEAGDIRSVQDLKDIDTLALALKKSHGIQTYSYTHNIGLLLKYKPIHFTMNLSVDSCNQEIYDNNRDSFKRYNRFKAVVKTELPKFKCTCLGHDCMSKCKKCLKQTGRVIHVGIH